MTYAECPQPEKVKYASEKSARHALKVIRRDVRHSASGKIYGKVPTRAYKCECGKWHLNLTAEGMVLMGIGMHHVAEVVAEQETVDRWHEENRAHWRRENSRRSNRRRWVPGDDYDAYDPDHEAVGGRDVDFFGEGLN